MNQTESAADMRAARILIIDDEQAILDSFQEYLEDYGYEIVTADNGRLGLEEVHRKLPDLILVDLRMPEVGGLEVLAQVASFSPMTPMIVVSGTGTVGDAADALHNGAWDYLLKPVEDLSLLLHAVETALEKSRLQKENLAYKTYLEKLVEERTVELKQANVHLEQLNLQLTENEKRLRRILDTLPVGIFIVDVQTDIIQYTNPHAASLLEKQPVEIVGKAYVDVLQTRRVSDAGERNDPSEQLLLHVNGREVVVLREVSLAQIEGRESYVECIIDISDQVKAEEEKEALQKQLLHADKMEALGTLAGGVAHDFNNILSAVIGFADLGLIELPNRNESIHGKLQSIKGAAERARDLVEQIRSFSRMQQQVQIPMNVVPVVREVVKLLSSSLPADIRIKMNLKTGKTVLGDPTQIHQVVMNLCTNAYHAMQKSGGLISLTLDEVETAKERLSTPPALEQAAYVRITVADTGPGMDQEIVDRIFEPYFTTKGKTKGTGLGLAIVHSIVRQHKGEITVTSSPGEGTVFQVFLPVSEGETVKEQPQRQQYPRGSEHVLVVDDEETLVQITTELLQHLGYRVTGVVNSLRALELFREDPLQYDLVISDYDMPELKGMQLAFEIHSIRPEIPIMICSGYLDKVDQGRADALGIKKVLNKPLSIDALACSVREALEC